MEKAEKRPDTLSRDFCIRQMEGEGNERRFSLSFSSEEPYERWWGVEILDHSEGAADLTRLSEIGCVLYNHNRDKVIGKITEVAVKDGRGEAVIEIDEDAESEVIYHQLLGRGCSRKTVWGWEIHRALQYSKELGAIRDIDSFYSGRYHGGNWEKQGKYTGSHWNLREAACDK